MRTYEIHAEDKQEQPTAVVEATLAESEIPTWMAEAYHDVAEFLEKKHVPIAGAPFSRFHVIETGRFTAEAGFPVATPVSGDGTVHGSSLPGGPVVTTIHTGPYEEMEPAYDALRRWTQEHGVQPTGDAWEVYFSDPAAQPDPSTWRTEIVQPYRKG